MVKVLRTIWGVYCVLIFFVICILVLPVYFIAFSFFGKRALRFIMSFSYRYVAPFVLFLFGVRLRVYGKEHIDQSRTYVIVSNHQSKIDMLINGYTSPALSQFLSKKEMGNLPFFGYIAKHLTILIDRKDKESKEKGFEVMEQRLNEGIPVVIYPEGTRNKTDQPLKKMYDGAFRLAIQSGYPILVQTILNSYKLASPHYTFDQSPGTITAYWDPPIETEGMTMDDIPRLREQVQQVMRKRLENSHS
ncbi:MAG: hypothetical protein BRD50_04545 [Bacteroidetes bacterium SW_11_45_7]|nr:MAG: hypothetical protein BRD50_04545 [Bacteroidetes bacterium SW_11_45_7]